MPAIGVSTCYHDMEHGLLLSVSSHLPRHLSHCQEPAIPYLYEFLDQQNQLKILLKRITITLTLSKLIANEET